jgi:glutamate-1-semialdehyde 2,1-aminomutase
MAESNEGLFKRANDVIPGGVNSPVRAFGSVGGVPYFVARADGAHVWDVEGNRYLDYVQSWGASILGHANPAIVAAVQQAATAGTSFGAPTEREVVLAESLRERVPGCEMVRLVSSGTEACMSVIRLARGCTGRSRIIKFAGCYHGHSDALLAAGGSGVATLGLSGSAGVPDSAVAQTVVAPYNVVPDIDEGIACVIVEPVAANMGLVPAAPGFLRGLRERCDRAGALLIFDEVITGFRIAYGGAVEHTGVSPDLWTFGKVIGGGLPLAAFGGRRDVMERLAPAGPVYQAGTLSGNPLATAAGLAALAQLDPDAYGLLRRRAARLAEGMQAAIGAHVPVTVTADATLVGLFFTAAPVRNYDEVRVAADTGVYPRFFHAMLDRGIALAPSAYEVLFPSLAHTDADIERTIDAAGDAAASLPG